MLERYMCVASRGKQHFKQHLHCTCRSTVREGFLKASIICPGTGILHFVLSLHICIYMYLGKKYFGLLVSLLAEVLSSSVDTPKCFCNMSTHGITCL